MLLKYNFLDSFLNVLLLQSLNRVNACSPFFPCCVSFHHHLRSRSCLSFSFCCKCTGRVDRFPVPATQHLHIWMYHMYRCNISLYPRYHLLHHLHRWTFSASPRRVSNPYTGLTHPIGRVEERKKSLSFQTIAFVPGAVRNKRGQGMGDNTENRSLDEFL